MIALLAVLCLQSASARPSEMQDPDRLPISSADLKALRDNNIFSPHRAKTERSSPRREERRTESRSEAPAAKPKPPIVTGIFFDETAKAYQAVIEDRNEERLKVFRAPKYLKAGEEYSGLKVQSVEGDKIVLLQGETPREIRIGGSLPETDAKPLPPEGPSSTTSAPTTTLGEKVETPAADPAEIEKTKEELKEKNKKKNRGNLYDQP